MLNIDGKNYLYMIKSHICMTGKIIVFAAFLFSHFIKILEDVAPIDHYHKQPI